MEQTNEKLPPTVVGVILDMSSSMKRNWKNKDGKELPRAEEIRNALNAELKRLQSIYGLPGKKYRKIDLFCLGIGFKVSMAFSKVEIKNGYERELNNRIERRTHVSGVCDLLALSEIVPTKTELQAIRSELDSKWNLYAQKALTYPKKIDSSIYIRLQEYIQMTLSSTATTNLHKSWQYRIHRYLLKHHRLKSINIISSTNNRLVKYIEKKEQSIENVSKNKSKEFLDKIMIASEQIFERNKNDYVKYIQQTLYSFVISEADKILQILTAGHSVKIALNIFNEDIAYDLAENIYQKLRVDVNRCIRNTWVQNKLILSLAEHKLGASLNSKEVQALTEKCIQKKGWSILEPFVEKTVSDLFGKGFKQQAEKMFPFWIELASYREITRSIDQIALILPDALEQDVYTDEFMFGATPIENAITRASIRLLDKTYQRRQKILIVVSDGEFQTPLSLGLANLLKKAGVTVIACCVMDKDLQTEVTNFLPWTLPAGAKALREMASKIEGSHAIVKELVKRNLEFRDEGKFFYQINQSDILRDIFEAILAPHD